MSVFIVIVLFLIPTNFFNTKTTFDYLEILGRRRHREEPCSIFSGVKQGLSTLLCQYFEVRLDVEYACMFVRSCSRRGGDWVKEVDEGIVIFVSYKFHFY